MRELSDKKLQGPLVAENGTWLTANKKVAASILQPQDIKIFQQPCKQPGKQLDCAACEMLSRGPS